MNRRIIAAWVCMVVFITGLLLYPAEGHSQCPVTSFPYTEDFDTVTAQNFPCGWQVTNNNGDNFVWEVFGSGAFNPPNAVSIRWNPNLAMDDWFFSPQLSLQAGVTYELKFRYKAQGSNFPERLEVFLGTGQTAGNMNTQLFSDSNVVNQTYQLATTQFTAPSTGTFHIGFHGFSQPNQFRLFVDNVQIQELSQSCPSPINLVATNFTASTAEIQWSGNANNTFEVEFGPQGFSQGSGTTISGINSTSVTLTGLSADTTYDVFVRQVCAPNDKSVLIGPETFILNDSCIHALPAVCNAPLQGTTNGASAENVTGTNCGTAISTPGVWYTFTGTGNMISATTCSQQTGFDTKISVFEGSCGNLVCVGGNDDFNGCATNTSFSQVSWPSTAGTTYYILVHGFNGATGDFTLSVNTQGIADAGANDTICIGDSTTLTATGGTSFDWSTGDTTSSIDVAPAMTKDYLVTVTTANGCTDSDTVRVVAADSTDGGTVMTESGQDTVNVCIDNNPDIVAFDSMNMATAGASYSYIITDASNTTILATPSSDQANFNPSGVGESHVWGVSHVGNLNAQPGQSVSSLSADVCFELSSNFIVVLRDSVDGGSDIDVSRNGMSMDTTRICIDSNPDTLSFINNSMASANTEFTYVATDKNNTILASFDSQADFNQAGPGVCLVYGVSHIGNLNAQQGQSLSSVSASVCSDLSSDFAVVLRDSVDGGTVSLSGGGDTATVCLGTEPNILRFDSATQATPRTSFTYIVTDSANTTVLASIPGDVIDASQAQPGEFHVWGVSHVGPLNLPQVPGPLTDLSAGQCFELSSNFVTLLVDSANANAGMDDTICAGETTSLTASGNGSFAWSNGSSSATITVSPTVTTDYVVTVTTPLGCTTTDTATVMVRQNPTVSLPNPTICPNSSTTLDAGNPGASYNWSTGDQTQTITVSSAGDFRVTVTDNNGCTGSDTATVTIGQGLTVNLRDWEICQGDTAMLDAGNSGASFNWSNGDTTQTIKVTSGGSISVTVTDASGCTGADTASVTVNPLPPANAGSDKQICQGDSATLTASGGSSYQWSNNMSGASITVAPMQTTSFTVTVTDTNGCSATDNALVNVNPNPTVNLSNPTICPGSSATLDAGNPGATFSWSTGENTQTITVSNPGTFSVTVTDANGCTASDTSQVTLGTSLAVDLGGDKEICQGDSVVLDAGNPGATYMWSNGATSQTITVTSGGLYSVTVTDNNNCTGSDTSVVTVNPLPAADAGNDKSICQGNSTTLSASGGSSFQWSNGMTTPTISVSPMQTTTYTVTVTDTNGCSATDDVTVAVNPNPSVNLPDPSICPGSSTTLDAGNPGATYLWSNGATTRTITVSTPDDYSVTVIDGNNCTGSDTATVTTGTSLSVNLGGDRTICQGDTATLDAGNTGASFNWSTGDTSQIISVTTSQKVSVTVTDNNNCTGADTVQVNVNGPPPADAGSDKQICSGDSVTLTATGGATFGWSNGQSGASITVSPTTNTNYTVTVADTAGCTATDDVLVEVSSGPVVNVPDASFCQGGSTTLDAGNPSASHSWSTGASSQTITVSSAGAFSVTVTDTNGCVAADTAQVTQSTSLTVNLGNPLACQGDTVTLDAGNPGAQYFWNNGETTQTLQVTSSGTYFVTVIQGNCTGSDTTTLNFQPSPTAEASGDTTICSGGTASLSATGGTSYSWSNGMSGSSISVSPISTTTYTVTATNSGGCTDTDQVTVTVSSASTPPSNVTANNNNFCGGGTATLTLSGGNLGSGASWQWYTGGCGANSVGSGASITVSPTSTTTYYVRAEGGCNVTSCSNITINVAAQPNANAGVNDTICQGETATLTATGGNSYLWSNNETSASISVSPTSTQIFTVTVTNAQGCTDTDNATVVVNANPTANAGADKEVCMGGSVSLTATGGVSYSWSNGDSSANITVTPGFTQNFNVTVTDANGCQDTSAVKVTVNNLPSVSIDQVDSVFCEDDPQVTLTGSPAGGSFNGPGVSQNTFNPSLAGVGTHNIYYSYTDNNGCTNRDTTTATVEVCPGIEDLNGVQEVSVYPNPFTQHITLQLTVDEPSEVQMFVTDLTGRVILERNEQLSAGKQKLQITPSDELSAGIYYLTVSKDGKRKTFKLVRTR